MIERRAEFIRELDSLCENIVNCGELNYDEEKMEEAINRADELLYYGKEHGRDQIVMESREEES